LRGANGYAGGLSSANLVRQEEQMVEIAGSTTRAISTNGQGYVGLSSTATLVIAAIVGIGNSRRILFYDNSTILEGLTSIIIIFVAVAVVTTFTAKWKRNGTNPSLDTKGTSIKTIEI
jgi:hypothetical protein